MSTSARSARCDDHNLWVELEDGRTLGVPLAWFPRLMNASPEARAACEISRRGLHWPDLDEDLSVVGLLSGQDDLAAASAA